MGNGEMALIISLLIIAIFLAFILPYICYIMAFRRAKESDNPADALNKPFFKDFKELLSKNVERLRKIECRTLSIKSFDGLTFYARYYHQSNDAPLQIQCHGYRGNPLIDFSGGGLEAIAGGYNVLMIYQRAHGLSEGRTITFGEYERLDVLNWVNYSVKELEAKKIILMGISMGAATVLMTSELDLPEEVKCIVADCPYSTTEGIIKKVVSGKGLNPTIMYPFIKLGARMYGGFTPDLHNPLSAVKNAKAPILLIHGEADNFVPEYMSRAIYENAKEKIEYHVFPGARHGASYLSNPERYKEILGDFVNKNLH